MSLNRKLLVGGGEVGVTGTIETLDIFGDSSCVAHLPLQHDARDNAGLYSPSGLHAHSGTPVPQFSKVGKFNYATEFHGGQTGNANRISYLDNNSPWNGYFSVSCWVYVVGGLDEFYTILSKRYNSISVPIIAGIYGDTYSSNTSNQHRIYWGRSKGNQNFANVYSTQAIVYDSWNHIVLVNGGTYPKTYINGSDCTGTVSSGAWAWSHDYYTNSTELSIGGGWSVPESYWYSLRGKISNMRIFNKVVSSSEVTTLYNETATTLTGWTKTTDNAAFPVSSHIYYTLDSNLEDINNNEDATGNDISYTGGRFGSAVLFDGDEGPGNNNAPIGTYINTTYTGMHTNFTLSLWFMADLNGNQILWSTSDSWSSQEGCFVYLYTDGRVNTTFSNGSGKIYFDELSAGTIKKFTWHHYAVTHTTGGVVTVYIDGVAKDTATMSEAMNASTHSLKLGGYSEYDNDNYKGKMDSVRIFTSALSASNILKLYQNEQQAYIKKDASDPFGGSIEKAFYKFEENTGTTLTDSSGNGNNGTISGMTWTSTDPCIGSYSGSFDGSNDYVDTNYTLPAVSTISFSLWFKTTTTGTQMFIFGDFASNGANASGRFSLSIESSNNFGIRTGDGTAYFTDATVSAVPYQTGMWHHAVLTANGAALKLYVDGSLIRSVTSTKNTDGSALPVGTAGAQSTTLGRLGDYSSKYFNGKLDHIRFFESTLTGEQVFKLYAEGI